MFLKRSSVSAALFAVHVLSRLHTPKRARCVHVVRGADYHGIDILARLIEHLAEVFVLLCIRECREPLFGAVPIAVGQRYHVLCPHVPGEAQVDVRLAPRPNSGQV